VSRGIVIGRAMLMASARLNVAHYYVDPGQEEGELQRLRTARVAVLAEMEQVKDSLPDDTPQEVAALIDVHMMLLDDSAVRHDTARWIRERRYNAEWALTAQLDVLSRQFDDMDDAYLRERKHDLEQVVERLLRALQGTKSLSESFSQTQAIKIARSGDESLVLVAHDISPADMLLFKAGLFGGFVTDTGGTTSHTAIVARSLDIPAVVAAREATRLVKQDDFLIVDADAGVLIVDPSDAIVAEYRAKKARNADARKMLERVRRLATVTRDGVAISLQANIELPDDARRAFDAGADGVGLFRSEFLFMNRAELPDEEEQYEAYALAVRAMRGKPVTIRTIDVGADKPLDSRTRSKHEELAYNTAPNPALGLRAIRYSLSQPAMFRTQLRALLRAAALGPVRILVPMLAHASEITATFEQLHLAHKELGLQTPLPGIGAMIEVPAAALSLPLFVQKFDFLSIGTNDLIQYTLAIDRADESVAPLYDPTHPAVLRLIGDTISAGHRARKSVSLCGEMAGDTRYTALLLGMGLTEFSMHPSELLDVKDALLKVSAGELKPKVAAYMASYDDAERERLWGALSSPLR
jgi:phosphoenolpyruvate-protein phosphotransferase (PTS system enzyme I)